MSLSRVENNSSSKSRKKRRAKKIWGGGAAIVIAAAAGLVIWNGTPIELGTPASQGAPDVAAMSPVVSETPATKQASPIVSASATPTAAPSAGAEATPSASPTVVPSSNPVGSAAPAPADHAAAAGRLNPAAAADPAVYSDPGRIHMSFVGDVLLAGSVDSILRKNGYDYPYRDVKADLQKADLAIADMEMAVTTGGAVQAKEYVYRANPLVLPPFKAAGFDLVTLANNHSMDYGRVGLTDTFNHLRENGIPYVGAGNNAEEAFRPVIFEKKGMKIAFLAFTRVMPETSWKAGPKTSGLADTYGPSIPLAVEAIKKAKSQADLVVVLPHWGIEREDFAAAYQRDLARRYIDAGADLIVGGHPHVLQGVEQYKGKWIAYSLGNFIFSTNAVRKTLDSVILEASCTKDGDCALKAVPIFTQYAKPERMKPDAAAALFKRLTDVSYGAGFLPDGRIAGTAASAKK